MGHKRMGKRSREIKHTEDIWYREKNGEIFMNVKIIAKNKKYWHRLEKNTLKLHCVRQI